jgi:hypothetical protein
MFGWLKKILGVDSVVSGKVIDKRYGGGPKAVLDNSEQVLAGQRWETVSTVPTLVQSWELHIEGKNKADKDIKEWIQVSELDYNTTTVGDPWPLKKM